MRLWQVWVKQKGKKKWRQVKPGWFRRKNKSARFAAAKAVRNKLRRRKRKSVIRPLKKKKRLAIVKRAAWGANRPRSTPYTSRWTAETATIVHHTVGKRVSGKQAGINEVRSIQRFHQETRGWADIAYNYLIGDDGTVYEGRGKNVRNAASGSNKWNMHCAIAFMGNFSDVPPTGEAIRAYKRLRKHLGLKGRQLGHREVYSGTSCPGNALMRKLLD